jgi:hypothetical protein
MKSFQTYTPRVRRLAYDALITDLGCQAITGSQFGASKPFERICIIEHDAGSAIFAQSDLVSYAVGPLNTGDFPIWVTPWAAWVASAGIRVGKFASITPPANNLGVVSSLFPTLSPPPKKVTIGFTSIGQIGIAIQKNETSIQVKWFKSAAGDFGDQTFSGVSPLLFGNSLLSVSDETGANDLVLYYLRPEIPRSLFARFERDNFNIEHLVHSNLPIELGRLISTKAVADKQELYALDSLGRDVTFYSPAYTVSSTGDKETLDTSIYRGAYGLSSIPALINTGNAATLSLAVVSGSYNDIIVEPATPLSGDAQSLSIAIESGLYE